MWQEALRAVGRGFVAVAAALWGNLALPFLEGVRYGLGLLVRLLAPWVIGGIVLLLLIRYAPEVANALLTLAVIAGLAYAGWRFVTRR